MNLLKDYPQVRKYLYATYASVGILIGALDIGFATNSGVPYWLDVTTRIFAYLGVALGFTASANVSVRQE